MPSREIILKYPALFGEPPFSMEETLIGIGIDVGPGWIPILENLFEEMNLYVLENEVHGFLDTAEGVFAHPFRIKQVKKMHGELHIHTNTFNETIKEMISNAKRLCEKTCEVCGSHGVIVDEGLTYVRCEDHKI